MAVNIDNVNKQADEISSCVSMLQRARSETCECDGWVSASWRSKEVLYILSAIEKVSVDIERVINSLDALSRELVPVAKAVNREEAAAFLRQLKAVYDKILEELGLKRAERERIERQRQSCQDTVQAARFDQMLSECDREIDLINLRAADALKKYNAAKK